MFTLLKLMWYWFSFNKNLVSCLLILHIIYLQGKHWFSINFILFFFNKNILMTLCCSQCELSSVIIFPLFHLCAYHKYLWRESQRSPAVNPIYLIKSNLEELFLEVWLFWTLSNEWNKLCKSLFLGFALRTWIHKKYSISF